MTRPELEPAPPVTGAERRVMIALAALVAGGVAVSTVLHHRFPQVLRVPGLEGVPRSSLPELLLGDVLAVAVSYLCVRHAWRFQGGFRAMLFLAGSFVFTGVEESMWIIGGRFTDFVDAYYFTRGFFWFLETPVLACLGWFFLAYGCMYLAEVLFPLSPAWIRAGLAAFLAMNLDLWVEPYIVRPEHRAWVWLAPDRINLLSIPLYNFIGWWMLIFIFALVYERLPGMVERLGPVRAAARFLGLLLVLELGILLFFIAYLSLLPRLVPTPVNFTVWGI